MLIFRIFPGESVEVLLAFDICIQPLALLQTFSETFIMSSNCSVPQTPICPVGISTAPCVFLIHLQHHVSVIVFHHTWEGVYAGEEWGPTIHRG